MARKIDSITELHKQIGIKIRIFRIERALSSTGLAEKIGVTHQQLNKYEKGQDTPSIGRLLLISNVLGKDINSFLQQTDEDKLPENAVTLNMIRNFSNIKCKVKKDIVKQIIKVFAA